jgi:hypothetical protein
MPKFLTIGCRDREGYGSTPKALRDEARALDEKRVRAGALMGVAVWHRL